MYSLQVFLGRETSGNWEWERLIFLELVLKINSALIILECLAEKGQTNA